MNSKIILLLLVSLVMVLHLPCSNAEDCQSILKSAGVSDRYPGVVAHGIHSIHVGALSQLEPHMEISENNGIPTINTDLRSDIPILPNAPDHGEGNCFTTNGMQTVDRTLSHMDNPYYDIKQYSALERLVHALHMDEVWFLARLQYANITKNPPSKEACSCALDIEENGIMKMLRLIALQIREPGLMYGKHVTINGKTYSWDGNAYSYGFGTLKKSADKALLESKDAIPSLINEAAWGAWKSVMMAMEPSDDYELAFYLYCALHKE